MRSYSRTSESSPNRTDRATTKAARFENRAVVRSPLPTGLVGRRLPRSLVSSRLNPDAGVQVACHRTMVSPLESIGRRPAHPCRFFPSAQTKRAASAAGFEQAGQRSAYPRTGWPQSDRRSARRITPSQRKPASAGHFSSSLVPAAPPAPQAFGGAAFFNHSFALQGEARSPIVSFSFCAGRRTLRRFAFISNGISPTTDGRSARKDAGLQALPAAGMRGSTNVAAR